MLFFKKKPKLAPVCMLPIVGMNYYTSDIDAIGTPLKGYNLSPAQMSKNPLKQYYKYYFKSSSAALVPDPHNKADKKAIKVVVDGRRVGFVPAESTDMVRQYLAVPHSLEVNIYGGSFRYWLPDPGRIVSDTRPYKGEIVIKLQ